MLAKVAGQNRFKVGNGVSTWSKLEYISSIALGNGLAFDENGQIVVDFSVMPTEKFEALVKSIRVPIWLEKNTNFYVDGATGSDVLSSGRGLSINMAFKTIQACVNYVCDNYNINRYSLTIYCNKVETSTLILSSFQYSTGSIIIRKSPTCIDEFGLFINCNLTSYNRPLFVNAGNWSLYDVRILYSSEKNPTGVGHITCIYLAGGILRLTNNIKLEYKLVHTETIQHWGLEIVFVDNGTLLVQDNIVIESTCDNVNNWICSCFVVASELVYQPYLAPLVLSGKVNVFMQVKGGYIGRNPTAAKSSLFDLSNATIEYSYYAHNGGVISSSNAGPDWLGTSKKYIDTSTYSWYK